MALSRFHQLLCGVTISLAVAVLPRPVVAAVQLPQRQAPTGEVPAPELKPLVLALRDPACDYASVTEVGSQLAESLSLQKQLDAHGFSQLQESQALVRPTIFLLPDCQRVLAPMMLQAYEHFLADTPREDSAAESIRYFTRGNWRLALISVDAAASPDKEVLRARDDFEMALAMLATSSEKTRTDALAETLGAADLTAIHAKPPENRALIMETAIAFGDAHLPVSTDNYVRYFLENLLIQRDLEPKQADTPAWRQRVQAVQTRLEKEGAWRYAAIAQHQQQHDEGARARLISQIQHKTFTDKDCKDYSEAAEDFSFSQLADFYRQNAAWADQHLRPYCKKLGAAH